MNNTSIFQWIGRITGLLALSLGIAFWTGNAGSLVILHTLLGSLLTVALFVLVYQAYRAGVSTMLVGLAAIWAIGLPIYGLLQNHILPDMYQWLAQVLHLLCALGAMGLAEILGAKIRSTENIH
jgi:hypothetical protein